MVHVCHDYALATILDFAVLELCLMQH